MPLRMHSQASAYFSARTRAPEREQATTRSKRLSARTSLRVIHSAGRRP